MAIPRQSASYSTVTREQLLHKLEGRLAETLREYGISATVVAVQTDAGSLALSPGSVQRDELSSEVLTAVQDTVRDFIAEHQLEIACLFSTPRDPSTLN